MLDEKKPAKKKLTLAEKSVNAKTRLARQRKEDLRALINGAKLINQIVDIKDKVADVRRKINPEMVARYRLAIETNIRLLAKVVPDLKAVEMTGPDGGDLTIQLVRFGPPKSE